MQKEGSDRRESERKQLGRGCAGYGKLARHSSGVFGGFFSLSLLSVSPDPVHPGSQQKVRKDS